MNIDHGSSSFRLHHRFIESFGLDFEISWSSWVCSSEQYARTSYNPGCHSSVIPRCTIKFRETTLQIRIHLAMVAIQGLESNSSTQQRRPRRFPYPCGSSTDTVRDAGPSTTTNPVLSHLDQQTLHQTWNTHLLSDICWR